MMRKVLTNLTATGVIPDFLRRSGSTFLHVFRRPVSDRTEWSDSRQQTLGFELPRVESLVDGCDYKHWLVVMHPPDDYPQRDEIIRRYVDTLAVALGSKEAATESMYSVSTKYYYAFGCKVTPQMSIKIKSLPHVKWVLPDSFLPPKERGYGGEPYINGKVVPYEGKYHSDWLQEIHDEDYTERIQWRKPRRERRGAGDPHERSHQS